MATFLAILKALPQLLGLIRSLWSMWSAIRYQQKLESIQNEVSSEHDKIAEGGRPNWDRS